MSHHPRYRYLRQRPFVRKLSSEHTHTHTHTLQQTDCATRTTRWSVCKTKGQSCQWVSPSTCAVQRVGLDEPLPSRHSVRSQAYTHGL